jgi:hypothetical protein
MAMPGSTPKPRVANAGKAIMPIVAVGAVSFEVQKEQGSD